MIPLFIFGAGGHARDIAEIAAALGRRPIFVTRDAAERDAWSHQDEIVLEDDAVGRSGAEFAVGIGDNRKRSAVAARWREKLAFPTLVHPDTSLARGIASLLAARQGTAVFPGVRIMGHCRIGDFATLNLNATVSHDCTIGDFANLSPGAHIAGNVWVGEGAWIGMGAVVNQGKDDDPLRIGAWSTVGSGAVVLRDVPQNAVHAGVPARDLRA